MKYIRTKDGIYSYEPTHNVDVDGFVIQHMNGWNKPLMKEDIIKITDTIEELCDEFVVYVKDNIKAVRIFPKGKAMEYSTYLKQTDNLDSEIYGAIFTGKGLIYVAKMNEKGELELL